MFTPKQTIRFVLSVFAASLTLPATIEAYPYAYRRLVKKDKNGKIVKIIDLISDVHIPENPKKSRSLGSSEKALLETLQKIGRRNKGEKAEFIGESNTDYPKGFFGRNFFVPIDIALANTFFQEGGVHEILDKLYLEFHNSKNKNLVYTHGDCLRRKLDGKFSSLKYKEHFDTKPFINKTILSIEKELSKYKQKIDETSYATIYALWDEYKKRELSESKFIQFIQFQTTGKYICFGTQYSQIMDFEIIMKIFSSQYKHNIVYAGGAHCDNLSDWLAQEFNFTLIKDSGGYYYEQEKEKCNELRKLMELSKKFDPKNPDKDALNEWLAAAKEFNERFAYSDKVQRYNPLPASTWKHLEEYPDFTYPGLQARQATPGKPSI